jgi:hypothetical protein
MSHSISMTVCVASFCKKTIKMLTVPKWQEKSKFEDLKSRRNDDLIYFYFAPRPKSLHEPIVCSPVLRYPNIKLNQLPSFKSRTLFTPLFKETVGDFCSIEYQWNKLILRHGFHYHMTARQDKTFLGQCSTSCNTAKT